MNFCYAGPSYFNYVSGRCKIAPLRLPLPQSPRGDMGQSLSQKSAITQCIALSHFTVSATVAAVGFTSIPCTLPVLLWPPHARYIAPCGRSPTSMHRSKCCARFSYCFAGGWTTNRPSLVFANSKASAFRSSATVWERSSVSQAYSEISSRVHPLFCTSG